MQLSQQVMPPPITPLGTAMREIAKLRARLASIDAHHALQPGCERFFHQHEELGLLECHILIDDDEVFFSNAWARGLPMTERLTEHEQFQIETAFLAEGKAQRRRVA